MAAQIAENIYSRYSCFSWVDGLSLLSLVQLSFQLKVGIMYCQAGQSSEEEMYNNEAAGPALEEFLQLLGERVRLKGFSKYRAQLDTKSESFLEGFFNRHWSLKSRIVWLKLQVAKGPKRLLNLWSSVMSV